MARVTIEDCIKRVSNPFDLVLFASQRAKELKKGEDSELNKENDKNSVISLREIAKNKIILNDLKNEIINLKKPPYIEVIKSSLKINFLIF